MSRTPFLAAIAAMTIFAAPAFADEACPSVAAVDDFYSTGWGYSASNERYQPRTTIDKSNVDRLALKWAFKLDGNLSPHSQPVVTSDTVFIGSQGGTLYALDRETGCVRWSYEADNEARTAIIHGVLPPTSAGEDGETLLFFGTRTGRVHAVVAATGEPRWVTDVRDHSMAIVTGTPAFHDGKLYVPVSSDEVIMAILPWYGCCTFRGSVVALDAASGEMAWRSHVVREEPAETETHYLFVQEYGPSGAPIWSAPTIDAERGLIYVGTGENYSSPTSDMSDAIVAMDLETGAIKWSQQYLAGDAFNVACGLDWHPNCPKERGPDLDFGAPPILTKTRGGQPILLAGQKSGGVYGLNPDSGERIWERTFGSGGLLGGVHWGMAVNTHSGVVFAPINDMQLFYNKSDGPFAPGLNALDAATGEVLWSTSMDGICGERTPCHPGLSAAIVATADLVFAGGLDGFIRAFDAATGAIIWSVDTWGDYEAVNGGLASGGTIDVHGPMIAGDMMFVQSGYASQGLQGGNAFLAFALKESEE